MSTKFSFDENDLKFRMFRLKLFLVKWYGFAERVIMKRKTNLRGHFFLKIFLIGTPAASTTKLNSLLSKWNDFCSL